MLWPIQPQLPFMYNSCFDFPWPPVVNGFATDFESFVIVPLLLCKTRHAVGPRVEVSLVRIVGWSMQVTTSTSRTSAAAHEVAISIVTLGLRDQGDSGLAGAGVPLAGRRWAETCLPMIIQPDDGADTWLLPIRISETPLCRKAELRSPSLAQPFVLLSHVDIRQVGARRLGQCCVSFGTEPPMGRTSMAGHRCRGLPGVATGRLSRCFWMQAQMLYCLYDP